MPSVLQFTATMQQEEKVSGLVSFVIQEYVGTKGDPAGWSTSHTGAGQGPRTQECKHST